MKFQRMRDFIMGAAVASLVLSATTVAFAKVAGVNIPVQYNNIKVLVDGKELQTEKEPFIYDGTTYLPLRAVAEAVGKEVSWDSATKTAILTGGAAELPQEDTKDEASDKTNEETKSEADTQQSSRWIRVTNKVHAYGDSVEIKCTDIRENLRDNMLEMDFKFDNTGSANYDVWIEGCFINGKRIPIEDELFANAYSDRKTEETLKIKLSDLDAADINKIHEISMTFHGYNVDGGKGFVTNALKVQFKA